MLVELHVRDLGVIEDATVELGPGMTALTGETGAGKTLLVGALGLLLGGRADPVVVRPGRDEALVEGRFDAAGEERILARAVAARGRSRAWVDGRMAPVAALGDAGAGLVEVHGQHGHHALFEPAAQRRALDRYGRVDHAPLDAARAELAAAEAELDALGGDERTRAREADLLRYQLAEIADAGLADPDEDAVLAEEEGRLADATALRQAAASAAGALGGEDEAGAVDRLGDALAAVSGRPALVGLADRLVAAQAELADLASELRTVAETWEDDPARLEEVRARRQRLRELERKYGATVADVIAYGREVAARLDALDSLDERVAAAERRRAEAARRLAEAEAEVGAARRAAAPGLGRDVQSHLRALAMPRARLEVAVGDRDPGDDVTFRFAANPGEALLALAKVASGGELARVMLALRLVLSDAPDTMVFDEVDAGVGGEAAVAVGAALAELGRRHQVLVVTHLPQVAAFAHHHLVVRKASAGGRTVATVSAAEGQDRVVELARMLSGQPDSATARRHAEELLAGARR